MFTIMSPSSLNDDTFQWPDDALQATCSVDAHSATHTPPRPHRAPDDGDDNGDDADDAADDSDQCVNPCDIEDFGRQI